MVQNGIEGDGGLARAPVADDEFALPPADGEHAVDGEDARFQRLIDGLTVDNAGRGRFDGAVAFRHDLAHAVDGVAERPHDAPQKALADGHARAALGTADGAPLRNGALVAEEDAAHALALQIEHHAADARGKEQNFAVFGVFEPAHFGDAVAHRDHGADLFGDRLGRPLVEAGAKEGDDVPALADRLHEGVLELAEPAAQAPIEDLRPHFEAEAARIRLALAVFERKFFVIALLQKG